MVGLDGIRVLEVGGGVGVAYAGKLFADSGADVVRLEGDDDPVRARPHDVHQWINTNKRAMRDTPEARRSLLPSCDILLHGFGPDRAEVEGLGHTRLASEHPRLVVCSITPWGATGPFAEYAGEELTVIHGSSWGNLSPSAATRADLPPLKAPGHHASIMVATSAATAALAAFDRAERTGKGEHVDFSMFAAAAKMTEFAPATVTFLGFDPSRLGTKSVVPWGTYECRDGLIQITCPEENQWQALVELMGDPEWATLDVIATAEGRRRNPDLVDVYLTEWCAEQSVDELYRSAQRLGICATPVNTVSEVAADEHFEARGFFGTTPSGRLLPGPGAKTEPSMWRLRRDAPRAGEHDGETWLSDAVPPPSEPARPGRPLDGIRVCDFTWVWAGPFCTQQLAHLGADVIRLESPARPDIFRRMPFTPKGVTRTLDTAGPFQLYNSDKRSLAVDLRHPDARALVLRLVAQCDVVVDNFSVGTMAELGFGAEDLRSANPGVIVASLSGYGQTGPSSSFTAYGPAGGAMAGLYAANGYEDGATSETGIAVGDPGLGLAAAWAIVGAVVARRRTGTAVRVDAAMVEAVAATVGELWMERQSTGKDPRRRGNRDAAWAPHGCYPAAGDDQWVTIACPDDRSWRALGEHIDPRLLDDPRFASDTLRKENEDELDRRISAWTATRDKWETTQVLQAAGVAAFPSLSPAELWVDNPQLEALGMLETPDHPATGRRVVPGVPWRLTHGPNGLRRTAPLLGQHTDEVLVEVLGCSPEELASLRERGVIPAGV
jgi:crotonobetainyl-CoA:carnitine CoA-transferase CaiB-like acyl-CoA transferase